MTPIHFPRNEAFRTLLALLLGLIIVSFVRSVRSSSSAHATSAHYSRLSVRANPGDDGSPMDISSQGGVESTASVTPDEKLPWFETDSGKGCVLQTLMKAGTIADAVKIDAKAQPVSIDLSNISSASWFSFASSQTHSRALSSTFGMPAGM